jgi:hypothetical protein
MENVMEDANLKRKGYFRKIFGTETRFDLQITPLPSYNSVVGLWLKDMGSRRF